MRISKNILIEIIILVAVIAAIAWLRPGAKDNKISADADSVVVVRVAHMPNVTHAQAVIGRATKWFDDRLGKEVVLRWQAFNAGPSIIEVMMSGGIDIAYVGPGPAINGFVRSQGEALRVVAGAASGGAAFVVRKGSGIQGPQDLSGKKIATPQLGNTQDIALREWLREAGLKSKEKGGTVTVLPIAHADQLTLFVKGQLDGAWTVEPWVSRLVQEAGGEILFEESSLWPETKGFYATTVLVVRKNFLDAHPKIVSDWISAHVELTHWVVAHGAEAMKTFNEELSREVGKPLPEGVLQSAFSRLQFNVDPIVGSFKRSALAAFDLGFLGRTKQDLKGLFHLEILEAILQLSQHMVDPNWWQ